MLFKKITVVSETHKKTPCGQNAELLNLKAVGSYNYH
jgi:hypothetical protein